MNIEVEASFPPILDGFFDSGHRFYVLHGGRGSAKSWSVAQEIIVRAFSGKERILCCREIQNSIKQSVKKLLADQIEAMGVKGLFKITDAAIFCPMTGTEFIFSGLWNNIDSIKSMEGVTICWVEEAQMMSRDSWEVLKPTIRAPGSIIILTMNPRFASDPAYQDFIEPEDVRADAKVLQVNYIHNPWFPDTALVEEMEWMRQNNPGLYKHIWLGELHLDDDALVFQGNVRMEHFHTPDDAQLMFGQDYGFSVDPMAFVRSWLSDDEKTLYVDYESGGMTRLALHDHPAEMEEIPEARDWPIKADSARPEFISWLNGQGFAITATEKYAGSVEDGIAWLQSVNIVVHPRCQRTYEELRTHRFKRHAQTDEVTRKPEDANNHYIDALRYAWQSKWRRRRVRMGGR